jgi:hypothetical protein
MIAPRTTVLARLVKGKGKKGEGNQPQGEEGEGKIRGLIFQQN